MRRVFALLLLASGCSFPEYSEKEPEQTEQVETCRDDLLNGNETAVDCGPSCNAGCEAGQPCSGNQECATGLCNAGVCSVPSCSDGIKDRTESDVDCGGIDGCQACTVGKLCASLADCNGGSCNASRCQAPSCSDGLQNQDETDVDCGGASGCDRCVTKQHCASDDDCELSQCGQGRCQPASCEDGVKNGDETASDCGGSCVPCPDFSACHANDDCLSLSCQAAGSFCQIATCDDGIMNGDEPSTDCGKSCERKCEVTLACKVAEDCQSGACSDARCVPKSATNQALPTNGWIATASATGSGDSPPRKAIDGNGDTHWSSGTGQKPGMWFQVDMLKPVAFFRVDLVCTSNGDYPRGVRAFISDDGQTFTPISSTIAGEPTLNLDFGKAIIARYLKLEAQQDTNGLFWRIDELSVLQ